MARLRMSGPLWRRLHYHMVDQGPEHFAFLFARVSTHEGDPTFVVHDALLVDEGRVSVGRGGYEVGTETLLEAVNAAVRRGDALVECHSHGGGHPRFSGTDRNGLAEMIPYALESLSGRPYAATVWGDDEVYGEWFGTGGASGRLDSILAVGEEWVQLAPVDGAVVERFDRQLPWFGVSRQAELARLRIAVCGGGGTGSLLIQQLAYLGARNFTLIDPDRADEANLNRLVSAGFGDLGRAKTELAAAMIRRVAPDAVVRTVTGLLQSVAALHALEDSDLIFGCVDNDGARLVLNELAVAYLIPYIDLGVGIAVRDGQVVEAGGRVVVVRPDGPCLRCLGQIDSAEASYFLASPRERAVARDRGYVDGLDFPAPAVVSVNAAIVAAALNEFALWFCAVRAPQPLTELDLVGRDRPITGQWLGPRRDTWSDPRCVHCALRGHADRANLERYARNVAAEPEVAQRAVVSVPAPVRRLHWPRHHGAERPGSLTNERER